MIAWPLPGARMGQWIERRASARGVRMDNDAVTLLAEHTEGNLLAASQEIDRLALLHAGTTVSADDVASAASDHARFDIFDLPAKAVDGDTQGALKSLSRLRAEGVDVVPELIDAARRRGAECECLSYEALARRPASPDYDVIVCNFSLLGESLQSLLADDC